MTSPSRPAALDRFAASSYVMDVLGAAFRDVFVAIKRQECDKFGALVTDREYEWYLDTA